MATTAVQHRTTESTARQFKVTPSCVKVCTLNAARTWLEGQELALDGILQEAQQQQGLEYYSQKYMSDGLGIRLSLDSSSLLSSSQRRSRWPVERIRAPSDSIFYSRFVSNLL